MHGSSASVLVICKRSALIFFIAINVSQTNGMFQNVKYEALFVLKCVSCRNSTNHWFNLSLWSTLNYYMLKMWTSFVSFSYLSFLYNIYLTVVVLVYFSNTLMHNMEFAHVT